ncbi:MAG: nucleoside triphosphate pyrophosphohydrolase family protein [Leptotrichiaceae bacterium]|nr:nucleoside triphosphate pyrophosphohydrolase family protein [Leptotrichiaceae bacterium]
MKRQVECVEEFHNIYKLGNSEKPIGKLENGKEKLRFELMKEENEEYLEAAAKGDIVEVADALGDMMYILCGTIIEHGMQNIIEEVFEEIHRSNLSKLDENGKPIYREDGKVIKGPNYFSPDIKKIIKNKL